VPGRRSIGKKDFFKTFTEISIKFEKDEYEWQQRRKNRNKLHRRERQMNKDRTFNVHSENKKKEK
jgi:hypothetical protein